MFQSLLFRFWFRIVHFWLVKSNESEWTSLADILHLVFKQVLYQYLSIVLMLYLGTAEVNPSHLKLYEDDKVLANPPLVHYNLVSRVQEFLHDGVELH